MAVFRTKNSTPLVYSNESRDFQLFGKSLDLITNMINADAVNIKYIIDTEACRNILLPLLQTKIGFFSNEQFDYEILRRLLLVFPLLIKNKGSKKALRQCVNAYFKVFNIVGSVAVMYINEDTTIYGPLIEKDTIVLVLNKYLSDISSITEFLKYIVPAGISTKIIMLSQFSDIQTYASQDNIEMIYVSTDINAALRGSVTPTVMTEHSLEFDSFESRLVSAVDTLEIISSEDSEHGPRPTLEHIPSESE